jgi:hypothetical protein
MTQTAIATPATSTTNTVPAVAGTSTITVKEMLELAGVSKVTLLKMLAVSGIQPCDKLLTGGRGRPAALYDRARFTTLLQERSSAKAAPKSAKTTKKEADAVAPAAPEKTEARALTVDEIDALLAAE